MITYNTISDFGQEPGSDYLTVSPHWLICIFRMKYPTTYSRSRNASFSTIFSDAVAVRGKPLIISNDCLQLQVVASKSSYLMQMQATLIGGGTNYLSEIFPGDYAMAWMFNNKEDHERIRAKLEVFSSSAGQSVNGFRDGLKFVGRVSSFRELGSISPSGVETVRYSLTGTSFNEFDAQVFYEPHLAEKDPQIGSYFGRLGASLNELIKSPGGGSTKANSIDVNKAIPIFLDLLLGKGLPPNLGRGNTDPRLQSTTGLTASYSYILPSIVGQALGKTQTSTPGGLLTYADVLEVVMGIQSYSDVEFSDEELSLLDQTNNIESLKVAQGFQPQGTRGGGSRRFTGIDMLGTFLPQVPHFYNKSVWSILSQYLNPAVNEMYTCLRVNADGIVVPTMVVRQLPFSSEFLKTDLEVTRFLSLPRWGIEPVMVRSFDVGRSDALRFNFVHIYGDSVDHAAPFASQIVRNPPIRDDLDIARSGLRPHMQTVACSPSDTRDGSPQKWMEISADILMGQQLTLTGSMVSFGIQSPICPGDNLEWKGAVYHIESVSHSCSIDPSGHKAFYTTLTLTHGVRSEQKLDDLSLYAGVRPEDRIGFEPGTTSEGDQGYDLSERPAANDREIVIGPDASSEVA